MRRKLEHKWSEVLIGLPESGMGYQTVDVFFADGSVLRNVVAFNAEDIELPDEFAAREIVGLQMHQKVS